MKNRSKKITIAAPPEEVFAQLDDFSRTGMHMTESSMMMMGSKLHLEQVSKQAVGPGATYRWWGKMLGMTIDFTQTVTLWEPPVQKQWQTEAEARIIIMRWYQMGFAIEPTADGSLVTMSIDYLPPRLWYFRIVSSLFANWYCDWCLNNMLNDAKRVLEQGGKSPIHQNL
jgi:hypothetical protein